jgi:hypothetical protein
LYSIPQTAAASQQAIRVLRPKGLIALAPTTAAVHCSNGHFLEEDSRKQVHRQNNRHFAERQGSCLHGAPRRGSQQQQHAAAFKTASKRVCPKGMLREQMPRRSILSETSHPRFKCTLRDGQQQGPQTLVPNAHSRDGEQSASADSRAICIHCMQPAALSWQRSQPHQPITVRTWPRTGVIRGHLCTDW